MNVTPRTIAVDFDGVIHSYLSGYTGPIPTDGPVEGAREGVARLRAAGLRVVVFSCRALTHEGRAGIGSWLERHGFEVDEVTGIKPHAVVYLDDRAVRFTGSWEEAAQLAERIPRPWNASMQDAHRSDEPPKLPTCAACGATTNDVDHLGVYVGCGHDVPGAEAIDRGGLTREVLARLRALAHERDQDCDCEGPCTEVPAEVDRPVLLALVGAAEERTMLVRHLSEQAPKVDAIRAQVGELAPMLSRIVAERDQARADVEAVRTTYAAWRRTLSRAAAEDDRHDSGLEDLARLDALLGGGS